MIKHIIKYINTALNEGTIDFQTAILIMDEISSLDGKEYHIHNKRIVYIVGEEIHDGYVNA